MTTRLLFVDDESNVLSALRRMLHGLRGQWDMKFATGGEEALRLMRANKFDVLITDMRMPGMGGVELLRAARTEHPGVIRIVLSGHTEASAAMRSVPLAHRFLSKPCDSATLVETVQKACDLERRLGDERLRSIIGRIGALPCAPKATLALNELLATDDVSIDSVADVVAGDAGISAKLLQLVNSAFFGLARQVTSVREAVAYLGINVVRNLATALDAFGMSEWSEVRDPAFLDTHHTHSHSVAGVAHDLVPREMAHEAFGIALLHDIGLLVMARYLPKELKETNAAVLEGVPRSVAERDIIGATHADLGAYLAGLWGLPYTIIDAIARHHEQPTGTTLDPTHATYIAEALLHAATPGWREDDVTLDDAYLCSLGLTPAAELTRTYGRVSVASP